MLHSVAIIAVAAIVTLIIRAVPFVAFGVKEINLFTGSHGIPELLSIAVVALLHIWKKNTLLSIAVGTILYMILVQVVF